MSERMEPSALLTAAADRVRDLAAQATPGTWSAKDMAEEGHPGVWWVDCVHEDDAGTTWTTIADLETVNPAADARWVAAMSPEVAPHLERWLREVADNAARSVPAWQNMGVDGYPGPRRTEAEVASLVEHHYGAALALARAILGVGLAGETP